MLHFGYFGLFAMLVVSIAALPIPAETLLVVSGVLMSQGKLQPVWTVASAFAGGIAGISLSYFLGRTVAHSLIYRYGKYVRLKPEYIRRTHAWFRRSGEWVLTFGYFVPGLRHFTALVAGMSALEYPVFASFAYTGAVVWTSTFMAIGYFLGDRWHQALDLIHRYTVLAVMLGVVALVLYWLVHSRISRE